MTELLDGLLWCGDCGLPMLSDGKGHYAHIYQLSVARLRALIRDSLVADKLADWFINLKAYCPECGEKRPFAGITKEEFMAHVSTRAGADDFARTVKDLFRETEERRVNDERR